MCGRVSWLWPGQEQPWGEECGDDHLGLHHRSAPIAVITDAQDVYDKGNSDTPSYWSQKSLAFTASWLRSVLRLPKNPCNGPPQTTCWSMRWQRRWIWVIFTRCCSKEFGARSLAKTSSSRRQSRRNRKRLRTLWWWGGLWMEKIPYWADWRSWPNDLVGTWETEL